jgi:hypothetical protein
MISLFSGRGKPKKKCMEYTSKNISEAKILLDKGRNISLGILKKVSITILHNI